MPTQPIQSRLVDGKYALTRQLGSGAAGVVYEAEHLLVGKRVALKLLRPELARDAGLSRRFVAEARAAARIGHANVVDIFDLGVARDGTCYLVMEFLDGETLFEILEQRGAATGLLRLRADAAGARGARGGARAGHRAPRSRSRPT